MAPTIASGTRGNSTTHAGAGATQGIANDVERGVEQHYARGNLERVILDALAASGKDIDRLVPSDLSPVDEFHTGARQATIDLAERLDFHADMHILDVGCGIGGPSRYLAETPGCRVTGIDLTPSFVDTAAALARRVGLADRVQYRQASALELPFDAGTFDGAWMLHVGMNIEDKARLFREIRRVVARGGQFAIFDVMRIGGGELVFPLPWATSPQTSFVETPQAYRTALEEAGFEVTGERNRRDFALAFMAEMKARAAAGGPPPLGLHVLIADVPVKMANYAGLVERQIAAPLEMVCRAR
jgi:SAM-dependent methyltransferase